MDNANFLRNIKTGDDADLIIAKLSQLKSDLEKAQSAVEAPTTTTTQATPDTQNKNTIDTIDESMQAVIMLKRTLRQFELLVDTFQGKADKTIYQFKTYIDTLIYDYKTAYDATETFNKDWFSNQMYSQNGKIELASYILAAITTYCKNNTETLQMISDGDVDIISYINLPRGYQSSNK